MSSREKEEEIGGRRQWRRRRIGEEIVSGGRRIGRVAVTIYAVVM